jgi:hypothetical protein
MTVNKDNQQSTSDRPMAGDGTQQESRTSIQPNRFGADQQPQEEFINDHQNDRQSDDQYDRDLDAQPVGKENQNAKNLTGDVVPQAPADIFPFGDPGSQSDG